MVREGSRLPSVDFSNIMQDVGITGDLDLSGDLTFNGGGTIATTGNGNLTLLPHGSGFTLVGDAGSTSHSLNSNDDFFVAGEFEVDSKAYFDNQAIFDHSIQVNTGAFIRVGNNTNDTQIRESSEQTVDSCLIVPSASSNHIIFCDYGSRTFNMTHAQTTNPTLFFHSSNSSITEWLSVTHDQTDGLISTGTGDLKLVPATGVISFGTHTGIGAESLSGYITVKDSGGTTRKLAVIS